MRTIFKLIVAIFVLAVLVSGAAIGVTLTRGGLHDATKWSWIHGLVGEKQKSFRLGDTGGDADLRFEVRGFSCDPTGVDDKCSARVRVKNVGDETGTLSPDLQYLRLDDEILPADRIEPSKALPKGTADKIILWNDVPSGGIRSIELHEALLSEGVRVPLGSG